MDNQQIFLKGPCIPLPDDILLQRVFEELIVTNNNITSTAQETALWSEDGDSISFGELNQQANLMARILRLILTAHGQITSSSEVATQHNNHANSSTGCDCSYQQPICVFMCSSIDRIVVLLACLKLGIPYMPLSLEYPHNKRQIIVHQSHPLCVIVSQEYFSRMDGREEEFKEATEGCPYFVYEELLELGIKRCNKTDNLSASEMLYSSPNPQALYIYTSGSTGEPQCVQISHRNLYNRLLWQWTSLPFSAYDICCQKTSLLFIDAHTELWSPLLRGIPSVVIALDSYKDLCAFTCLIRDRFITRVTLVPFYLRNWLDMLQLYGDEWIEKLISLELVVCSGEPLLPELALQFFRIFPRGKRLANLYGSTEVTGDVTWQTFSSIEDVKELTFRNCLPVGNVIINTDIILKNVVDMKNEDVSHGEASPWGYDVYVSGENVANHVRSKNECIPNPYYPQQSNYPNMLRMDDVGVAHEDKLYIIGRCANHVKIMGCRINTIEIDTVVRSIPGISSCHTMCLQDSNAPNNKPVIVTFYSLKDNFQISTHSMMDYCSKHLPTYAKVTFCHIQKFPIISSSGKVDIQRLKNFFFSLSKTVTNTLEVPMKNNSSSASRWFRESIRNKKIKEILSSNDSIGLHSQRRKEILTIFATHLKLPLYSLDLNMSFHEAGGDSLKAALIVNSLQNASFEISLETFTAMDKLDSLVTILEHGITLLTPLKTVNPQEQSVVEDEEDFIMEDLKKEDEEVIYFLADMFARKEPLCLRMRCSYQEIAHVMHEYFLDSLKINCSTIVRKRNVISEDPNMNYVGACIVVPSEPCCILPRSNSFLENEEHDMDESISDVRSFCSDSTTCSHDNSSSESVDHLKVFLHYCENKANPDHFSPCQSSVTVACLGVADNLHVKSALTMVRKMEWNTLIKAKKLGFSHVRTINMSLVTKEICRELGYTVVNETPLSEFLSELNEPLHPGDSELVASFAVKDLRLYPDMENLEI